MRPTGGSPTHKLLHSRALMDIIEDQIGGPPLAALRALREAAEHLDVPIYLVGGSVRDLLLGRAIKDLDFAVEGDAPSLAGRLAAGLGGRLVVHRRFRTASVYFCSHRGGPGYLPSASVTPDQPPFPR